MDYDLTAEIELLGLPSEELPSSRCLAMSDLNCSLARVPLFSALDILGHDEVQNSDEVENCDNSEFWRPSQVARLGSLAKQTSRSPGLKRGESLGCQLLHQAGHP